LKVTGDLIDNGTLALDIFLDPSSSSGSKNSMLDVAGSATISGTINFFHPSNVNSTYFHSGDTFTLMTAVGGITGTFNNLPAGVLPIGSSLLPILSVGLRWQVQYTSISLILKVIPVSAATNLHTTSIAAAPSNAYIGARSVSFAWTNHDPDILFSTLEVQDIDTGNFFSVARVEGNASSLTFNPAGNPGPYGFQVGGNYTVRLRTFTAAGAAYSAECSFQASDFAEASSDLPHNMHRFSSKPYAASSKIAA
jgi:hypothetical protein